MKQGWELKKLRDVCDFERGLTYSKKDEIDYSKNIILRSNNVDLTGELNFEDLKYIDDSIDIPEKKKVVKNSLLICTANGSKNHLGKVALIDQNYNYAFGGFMGLLKPKQGFDAKYLFYRMISESYRNFISALADGANINNLTFTQLGEFTILTPALDEQKRIVSILDEAFIAIDKAKANAEQNLKNARELFESYLQSTVKSRGKDREYLTVESLVEKGLLFKPLDGNHGEIHPHSKDYVQHGVPFIMACDMNEGLVDSEYCKFISEKQAKSLRTGFAKNGDVLLSHKGTIGRVSILQSNYDFVVLTPQVTFYRIKDHSKILNKFIFYYFLSPGFQKDLHDIANGGSTRAYIGITKQLSLKMVVPPLIEQISIVQKLDALSIQTKKLEAIYQQKIVDLDELKKSLLGKAFNGELKTLEPIEA